MPDVFYGFDAVLESVKRVTTGGSVRYEAVGDVASRPKATLYDLSDKARVAPHVRDGGYTIVGPYDATEGSLNRFGPLYLTRAEAALVGVEGDRDIEWSCLAAGGEWHYAAYATFSAHADNRKLTVLFRRTKKEVVVAKSHLEDPAFVGGFLDKDEASVQVAAGRTAYLYVSRHFTEKYGSVLDPKVPDSLGDADLGSVVPVPDDDALPDDLVVPGVDIRPQAAWPEDRLAVVSNPEPTWRDRALDRTSDRVWAEVRARDLVEGLEGARRRIQRGLPVDCLDLVGHAVTSFGNTLRIGGDVLSLSFPSGQVPQGGARPAWLRLLVSWFETLGKRRPGMLRLVGCGTATTRLGLQTMQAIADALGVTVCGTAASVVPGHFVEDGFDPTRMQTPPGAEGPMRCVSPGASPGAPLPLQPTIGLVRAEGAPPISDLPRRSGQLIRPDLLRRHIRLPEILRLPTADEVQRSETVDALLAPFATGQATAYYLDGLLADPSYLVEIPGEPGEDPRYAELLFNPWTSFPQAMLRVFIDEGPFTGRALGYLVEDTQALQTFLSKRAGRRGFEVPQPGASPVQDPEAPPEED